MRNAASICALAMAAVLTAGSAVGTGQAAALSPMAGAAQERASAVGTDTPTAEAVQYRRGRVGPRVYGPRVYGPPRAFAPRYYGRPAWGYRPWYRRPYYGTIIGGVALGAIIGAAAYGLAPRPPRPDLCWYWADEIQSQGYWDYC